MTHRRSMLITLLVVVVSAVSVAATPPAPKAAQKLSTPAPASSVAALPEGAQKVTSVEGITEYRLANGLQVLLFPDPSKQTTTVNITYLVGSRHEGYGETGMAHLLEHMVFKGTPNHKDIPQELTAHGARPNGTTSYDRTNYFETFAATEENLDWALDLESDRMVHSVIAKKDLDTEFSVVRNEFEMGENYPQSVLFDRIMSAAYLWHNYGKSTIGSRTDIERVPIENLRAFYKTWYQPDNALLVIAGNLDESATLAKIVKKFGKIPKPSRALPATYTVEPPQDGPRSVALRRVGDTQMVAAGYHIPAGSHPDFAPIYLLSFILGDAPSGRLYKALVEPGKAAEVFWFARALHDPGMLLVGADVRMESSLDDARDILVRVTEDAAVHAPTREEVDRARENLLKNWETMFRNSQRVALILSEWAAQGDWRLMFLHRDRIKAVTPEDVARVAKAYLRSENRTVGVYIPTKEPQRAEIPPPPDVEDLVRNYKGGEGLAVGEEFDPSPAAIETKLTRAAIPPGIKLVMLPKKTRGGIVQVAITLNLGDEKSLQGRAAAGNFAGGMLMRGTTKRTRQQIKDETDRLKAQLIAYGYYAGASVSLEVPRENLAAALRLAAELLREPSFPAQELELLRQERLAGAEDSKSDPTQKASTRLQKHLNPWPKEDPRYGKSPEESIEAAKAVTLDEVKRFHAEFYGASSAQIAVVGDFDPGEMKTLLTELFADWKNARPYARLVDAFQDRPAIHESIEAPDKESAYFTAGLRIEMRDDASEYPAMVLGNFMTGGGFLNSRLADRLRQKDGISYGAGSYFYASPFDRDAYFGASAIYAPQNAERLMAGYKEELAKILDKGFTAEEINEAKKGWLQQRKVSRASDRELVYSLASHEYIGRTLAWDETLEKKVQSLTNEEIVAAMRKVIDLAKISTVQSGDFAKVKQTDVQRTEGGTPK